MKLKRDVVTTTHLGHRKNAGSIFGHVYPPILQNEKRSWVEVNAAEVRVENVRQFGGPWLASHMIQILQRDTFLRNAIPEGREHVPWDITSLILIIARLLEPSSELHTAEQWYPKTAPPDLLGVAEEQLDAVPERFILCRNCIC